jgi:hypothetical protein
MGASLGVVILSAVLKRRMTLADKAKSLFISKLSYEIHLPIHWHGFDSHLVVSLTSYALLYMASWQPPSCFLTRN